MFFKIKNMALMAGKSNIFRNPEITTIVFLISKTKALATRL